MHKKRKTGNASLVIGIAAGGLIVAGISAAASYFKKGCVWFLEQLDKDPEIDDIDEEGSCQECRGPYSAVHKENQDDKNGKQESPIKAAALWASAKSAYDAAEKARDEARDEIVYMEDVMKSAKADMEQAAASIAEHTGDPIPAMYTDMLGGKDNSVYEPSAEACCGHSEREECPFEGE